MRNSKLVYQLVNRIPKGKVTTYAKLATLSGIKSPRVIGNILHKNTDPDRVPCHRVVNAKGELAQKFAFGGAQGQIQKLKLDSIPVVNGKVVLPKYFWSG